MIIVIVTIIAVKIIIINMLLRQNGQRNIRINFNLIHRLNNNSLNNNLKKDFHHLVILNHYILRNNNKME